MDGIFFSFISQAGKPRTTGLLRTLLFSACLFSLLVSSGCAKKEKEVPKMKERVTFCQGGHITLLTQTALERGYFTEEGLEPVLSKLGSGKIAMDTFLADDCNFGIMGEPPIVKQAFVRDDFAIIASLANSGDFTRILARKDRGISTGKDLKGKRLAVNKGTSSHTFADIYLKKQGLNFKDVTAVFMDLKDMPGALMAGDIDAYSAASTYFLEGKRTLGDNGVLLNEPGLYSGNSLLVAKKRYLSASANTVKKVLKALLKAEADIASNRDAARKLLSSVWKVPESDAEILMKQENNVLGLGQIQLDSLNVHANWLLNMEGADGKNIPDFSRIIDYSLLASVKPSGVFPKTK